MQSGYNMVTIQRRKSYNLDLKSNNHNNNLNRTTFQ